MDIMNEIKRTQNANKLFNRVLECESDLKQLYNTGFKLINLTNLDDYFRIRTKLRSTYERMLVDESDFALANKFDEKLWLECYEKPINWIESHLKESDHQQDNRHNNLHLRSLRSLLINFLDEGSTLFQLLLRLPHNKFSYSLSIYAAVLLRKRERFTVSPKSNFSRSFNLLQETITSDPQKSYGYLILAQWTLQDGDNLLAMYWGLVSCNIEKNNFSLGFDFLKSLARTIATSPSFGYSSGDDLLNGQVLQMVSHTLLSQLTGHSHLKHLDQLSHSQIISKPDSIKDNNLKSLKYSCTMLWMILGMNSNLFKHCNGEVSPVQSCLLAKLFQIHLEFIGEPGILVIFIAFATNPHYSKLFIDKNYEILSKINNFAFESLNKLLKAILSGLESFSSNSTDSTDLAFLFILESFKQEAPNYNLNNLIEYFLKANLYSKSDDGNLLLRLAHEKDLRRERSMKLLTHRFLSSQLESFESTVEPVHLPWTIPDYSNLISQFPKIKRSVANRQMRLLITLPLLHQLDLDKNRRSECRDIIRFLHERVNSGDLCIRLDNKDGSSNNNSNNNIIFTNFREKLANDHLDAVKSFYENESKNIIIMCSESESESEEEIYLE